MERHRVVLELAEAAVAVEAEQRSDSASRMIMIDVRGRRGLANRTQTVLLFQHRVGFCSRESVATLQVVGTRAAQPFKRCSAPRIVTGLAIGVPTRSPAPGCRKFSKRLDGVAIGTPLHAHWDYSVQHMAGLRRPLATSLRGSQALTIVVATVERQSIAAPLVPRERGDGETVPAVGAVLVEFHSRNSPRITEPERLLAPFLYIGPDEFLGI